MYGRRLVVLVIDLVLLGAVVAYVVWHSSRSDVTTSRTPHASTDAARQGTTTAGRHAQARDVGRALEGLERNPGALVAAASRDVVGDRARLAVPAGSRVTPIQRTWKPDGTGGGTMSVRVRSPGRSPVTYAAVMVRETSGWKVLATIPVPAR